MQLQATAGVQSPEIDLQTSTSHVTMMRSSTGIDGNNNELINSSPETAAPHETTTKANGGAAVAAACSSVKCEGVEFMVTERNEVAEVVRDGGGVVSVLVLDSESFFDVGTGTRHHFVDVQGQAEAMLFLVSVREDQRRIVAVTRCL